jgi:hypothetical protein
MIAGLWFSVLLRALSGCALLPGPPLPRAVIGQAP